MRKITVELKKKKNFNSWKDIPCYLKFRLNGKVFFLPEFVYKNVYNSKQNYTRICVRRGENERSYKNFFN